MPGRKRGLVPWHRQGTLQTLNPVPVIIPPLVAFAEGFFSPLGLESAYYFFFP
jgi:hypothetical protein